MKREIKEKPRDKKDVMELVKEYDIKFIKLWFTDILGQLKSFTIPVDKLEIAFEEGIRFDGSSIKGLARIDESDMIAIPDSTTFVFLPWKPKEKVTARMFCDIYEPDGTLYKGDPRQILKRNLEKMKEMGFTKFYVGLELEFFYFKDNKTPKGLDQGSYFDYPINAAEDLISETIICLEQMKIKTQHSHHEVAPSQYEIDLKYAEALEMADIVMTYRVVVKEVAKKYGLYATFMPKPIFGINGSGMHIHQSLIIGNKNTFFDPNDQYHLSDIAKKYIAGLLTHIKEITLVLNQWVNSYKRLVPGYEAPVYISWSNKNPSTIIRVPMHKPDKKNATRIELRSPDPACNPYLAFACILRAGLEGIKRNYVLPDPLEKDIYHISEEEKKTLRLDRLPGSLDEAIRYAEKSELLRDILGDHIFNELILNKKLEWNEYKIQVFPYEIEKYLPIL